MSQLLLRVGPWVLLGSSVDLILRQDGWALVLGWVLLVAAVLALLALRVRERQRGAGRG